MTSAEIRIRPLELADLIKLREFECSSGLEWEALVEGQIRGPLPRRYLTAPLEAGARALVGENSRGEILVVGSHHIEPAFGQDIGYIEVVAVAKAGQGSRVVLAAGEVVTLGELMMFALFRDLVAAGRHRRTFARIDKRNTRSLTLCDRVGLTDERSDLHDEGLVQRWGTLPEG